jgi:SAM-dependent methyltransferase
MPHRDRQAEEDWYERTFSELYPILYAHRTVEAAKLEAEFAVETLKINTDHAVLDMACGAGRHMVHLRNHAKRVAGIDFSGVLLRQALKCLGNTAWLLRGDMRALPFVNSFNAVCSFFTSFGYFCSDSENAEVLCGVRAALKPNGRFLLDYMNSEHAAATIVPESRRVEAGFEIEERRWVDTETGRINKLTTVSKEGCAAREFCESVRLFTFRDLEGFLVKCGFSIDRVFGDYTGAPFANDSPRMILVATKGTT